ncbi:histidine--tRNA ligase [Eubacterium xylanophilum]|uniref:histidine--tRNA ligase n=1 Tax=Eubacterium xylanophilum TaxID=39497 RepID=UPI00047BFA7B|nr:histidine--tRNA ligase [Eubacterium xylanophilum]
MALKKKPVTGMKDILPKEMAVRDYVIGLIKKTYATYGFSSIETPCVEHIENLSSKQGGENEKLIFKILKRGEKLKLDQAECEADLVDSGLRYDLTVPLSRYYSNNANELGAPFKALQMGNVWRAERPQRGRFRQFMQCDIDIFGEPTSLAELELIQATSTLVGKLGFKNFTIRVNDRRILKAIATYCGFPEDKFDLVFIILDKMDKIGLDGIKAELAEEGFAENSIEKCSDIFANMADGNADVIKMGEMLGDCVEDGICENLAGIIETIDMLKNAEFKIVFDPTLVRGMGYYTGPIFEIYMDEFGAAVGGGGRYDEMVKRFTGNEVPACGFSIGFERIVLLLLERDFEIPEQGEKKAYLIDKRADQKFISEVLAKANEERKAGVNVSVNIMKKNKKFQKEQLAKDGYTDVVEFFCD